MKRIAQHLLVDLRAFLGQRRVWAVLAVGIVLFALAGPFGSYVVLGFPMRLAMWAVVGRERQGGKLWVVLRDGSRLPVSRSYARHLGQMDKAG